MAGCKKSVSGLCIDLSGDGVIGLIPYLALREANQVLGKGCLEASGFSLDRCCPRNLHICLLAYALLAGDWGDFIQQFQSDRFISMSLALCLFYLLFPTVFGDDMARRGFLQPQLFWAIVKPLLGPFAIFAGVLLCGKLW